MSGYKNISPEERKSQMLRLMNFKHEISENKNTQLGKIEYQKVGANNKVYAIIRENNKFYIKVSEPKDTVLVEDFNYLGGGYRYKNLYEYDSYNRAYKIFEEYMTNLNDSHNVVLNETRDVNEFQQPMTESGLEMKSLLERQRQIMLNASKIMNEDSPMKSYKLNHPGDPEGEKKACDPEKQGEPFGTEVKEEKVETVKIEEAIINELSIDDDETILTDDTVEEPLTDENEIELDGELFDDETTEETVEDKTEEEIDKLDVELDKELITKLTDLESKIAELTAKLEDVDEVSEEEPVEVDVEETETIPFEEAINKSLREGKGAYLVTEEGIILHDFGKHPMYQKEPMTTPKDGEECKDKKPFGTEVGNGAPFEDIVNMLTDAIMEECKDKGIFKKVDKKKSLDETETKKVLRIPKDDNNNVQRKEVEKSPMSDNSDMGDDFQEDEDKTQTEEEELNPQMKELVDLLNANPDRIEGITNYAKGIIGNDKNPKDEVSESKEINLDEIVDDIINGKENKTTISKPIGTLFMKDKLFKH